MNEKLEFLVSAFEHALEQGATTREAFVEALEYYLFVYGDGTTPIGILSPSDITDLKEVRPAEQMRT